MQSLVIAPGSARKPHGKFDPTANGGVMRRKRSRNRKGLVLSSGR